MPIQMWVIERICDKVAVLNASRIAEEGTVAKVLANPRSEIARKRRHLPAAVAEPHTGAACQFFRSIPFIIVQIIQELGFRFARKTDKRISH
jgi:ABC-type methionine transport system ATPase subunit